MNTEEILKKLEEIKVDAINNLTSDDKKSKLQVGSDTEVPLDEDAAGEDTKKEPILGEKHKDPYYLKIRNLSRVTPMAGAESPPEEIYTSGEKKAITTESIQAQLDDLKKTLLHKTPFPLEDYRQKHVKENRKIQQKKLEKELMDFMKELDTPLQEAIRAKPDADVYRIKSKMLIGVLQEAWMNAFDLKNIQEAQSDIEDRMVEAYKSEGIWDIYPNRMDNTVTFKRL
jgi:hypothetical protein